jgi:DNA-binding NtrC family response regulator
MLDIPDARRARPLRETVPKVRRTPHEVFAELGLLGQSAVFHDALRVIERLAPVDASVLIQGETGTGKELAAHALHCLSPRSSAPFIPVNCGALPDNLLESELFGHERGAFTDARQANRGLVAQAEGGTLFFDEVEVMTPRAQVVLLRFLEDRHYRTVGGRSIQQSNIRILASSNLDLEDLVRQGTFRRDLLFRLNMLGVTMPPLRKRGHDAILLGEHFLDRLAHEHRRPGKELGPDAVAWMLAHDWPGNVRELRNLMLREFLLTERETIHLGGSGEGGAKADCPDATIDFRQTFYAAKAQAVAEFERAYLGHLMARTSGNISLAARLAGTDRGSLQKLVKKHGILGDRFKPLAPEPRRALPRPRLVR